MQAASKASWTQRRGPCVGRRNRAERAGGACSFTRNDDGVADSTTGSTQCCPNRACAPDGGAANGVKLAAVLALATQWSTYQMLVFRVLFDAPAHLGNLLLHVSGAPTKAGGLVA